jgi:hypothetical protein
MLERRAMQGAGSCPHCNVVADVEPHGALGFRCLVCGGPRVVVEASGVELSVATRAALKSAKTAHTKHLVLSAAGFSLLGMGGLSLLIASAVLLAASPGLLLTLLTLLACCVPLAGGTWGLMRAAAARRVRGEALHTARVDGLADAQAVLGPLDAQQAAQLLRIDADQAELLLAEATVASLLEAAPPRMRVAAAEAQPATTPDAASAEATEPAVANQRATTES